MKSPQHNREQSEAALSEFGFLIVPLGEAGAPTPSRIADRISDILAKFDVGKTSKAIVELRRLVLALDSYDGMMQAKSK